MRIKINFTKNTEAVPNNQQYVNSYIHNCLGKNNKYHNEKSEYCVSRLLSGNIIEKGRFIDYPNGGYILITSLDLEFINKIIMGVLNNPQFGFGMSFINIEQIEEEFYNGWNYFKTTNMGFLLKKRENKKDVGYYTLNDDDFILSLKKHIINKFSKKDPTFDFNNLEIKIDKHCKNKSIRVFCKNVLNITNVCQISINTNKKLAKAIYNYGLGQSTGSGFGTIYTTQKHELYK